MIDRFTQGYVTDFVSVGSFAIFNVADASISVGVAVLIVGMLIKEYQDRKNASQSGLDSELPVDQAASADAVAPDPDLSIGEPAGE